VRLPCDRCAGLGEVVAPQRAPRRAAPQNAKLAALRAEFPTWDDATLSDVLGEARGDVGVARSLMLRWTVDDAHPDENASYVDVDEKGPATNEIYPSRHPISPWQELSISSYSAKASHSLSTHGQNTRDLETLCEPLRRDQFDRVMVRRLSRKAPSGCAGVMRAAAAWRKYVNYKAQAQDETTASFCQMPSPSETESLQRELISSLPREQAIEVGRQRLRERCEFLAVRTLDVVADGNCQFRAISQELFGSQDHHAEVRAQTVHTLRANSGKYQHLTVETGWERYLADMSLLTTWGDELTLQAAAEAYGVRIHVVTSNENNWYLQYVPEGGKPHGAREVFLTYAAPVHYDCFLPLR